MKSELCLHLSDNSLTELQPLAFSSGRFLFLFFE